MSGYVLDPLEVATGLVLGVRPSLELVADERDGLSPLQALERAVLPALRRPPCVVSFSGGRDSSVVLAVAADVARREGLPLPLPATNRFPDASATDEREWQELVISHLGLPEWIRLDHGVELDCVGDIASDVLERHGLQWPFNAYFHVPLFRLATGGSVLTGIGGDELLSPSRWARALDVLHGRQRPQLQDAFRIPFALSPAILRRRILRFRSPASYTWLRPRAQRAFAAAYAAQIAADPTNWSRHYDWVRRLRYLHVGLASLGALATDEDVAVGHPFLAPAFGHSLATLPPGERFGTRGEAMHAFFGDLLPEMVLSRAYKTVFDDVFWNDASRSFAATWNGGGIDEELVDADALAAEWATPAPDPRSFLLLQAAWLAERGRSADRVEQKLDGVPQ